MQISLGRRALSAAGLVVLASLSQAAGFNFTFDSDVEGWTQGNFSNGYASIIVNSNGPAPHGTDGTNGYIEGVDHSDYAYHFSGDLGGGHGSLFGQTLQFDFSATGTSANDPFVVLMSSTDFLVLQHTANTDGDFHHYSFNLDDSETWYYNSSSYYDAGFATIASNAQIQAVLNDLRYLGISTDINNGSDATRTDNVVATPVPEPASMAILGLGVAALAKRRRK